MQEVNSKQLDEALRILDHALVTTSTNDAIQEFATANPSIPVYNLTEEHDIYQNGTFIYSKGVNMPIITVDNPSVYAEIFNMLPHIYQTAYFKNNDTMLYNGNRTVDTDILSFCMLVPEITCGKYFGDENLVFNGVEWDGTDLDLFLRQNALGDPFNILTEPDDVEMTTMLMRLLTRQLFVRTTDERLVLDLKDLAVRHNHKMGVHVVEDVNIMRKMFNTTEKLNMGYIQYDFERQINISTAAKVKDIAMVESFISAYI